MGGSDNGSQEYESYQGNCPTFEPEKFEPCGADKCPSWVEPVYGANGEVVDEVVYQCEACGGTGVLLKPKFRQ